jgi:CRISPR-associated exonuclease Cas4
MAAYTELVVTDLKNYIHCPRYTYFEHCLPGVRPRTYAMDAGDEAHEDERARARRRTLWQYGLPEGERQFDVYLQSSNLGLVGRVDELVTAPGGMLLPVDYKLSDKVNESFEMQVVAYALLLEATYDTTVHTGYVYLIGRRKLHTVAVSPDRRDSVLAALRHMRDIVDYERMPPPVRQKGKCRACEWWRFCNDVV